jgi:hypothetical protein
MQPVDMSRLMVATFVSDERIIAIERDIARYPHYNFNHHRRLVTLYIYTDKNSCIIWTMDSEINEDRIKALHAISVEFHRDTVMAFIKKAISTLFECANENLYDCPGGMFTKWAIDPLEYDPDSHILLFESVEKPWPVIKRMGRFEFAEFEKGTTRLELHVQTSKDIKGLWFE